MGCAMTRKAKPYSYFTRPLTFLAVALIMLPAGVSVARAGGDNDTSPVARSGTGRASIRTAPAKQGRQRLAEERAMVNALAGKRDPFKVPPPPKIGGSGDEIDGPLPPGVRGLVIGQLRLKGIVRDEETKTMIGVVTNRVNLAYFLHIHEDVYNGVVSRITPDAIYFQQKRPDSGGRIDAREVVLRLGSERQEAR
jgi:hypothetical protein